MAGGRFRLAAPSLTANGATGGEPRPREKVRHVRRQLGGGCRAGDAAIGARARATDLVVLAASELRHQRRHRRRLEDLLPVAELDETFAEAVKCGAIAVCLTERPPGDRFEKGVQAFGGGCGCGLASSKDGRASETNLETAFDCDALRIGMVKHPEVAQCLGGGCRLRVQVRGCGVYMISQSGCIEVTRIATQARFIQSSSRSRAGRGSSAPPRYRPDRCSRVCATSPTAPTRLRLRPRRRRAPARRRQSPSRPPPKMTRR